MATLYRKYRPQNFKEIVGQNHIKITLEHEIESGKIAHAYMFCGPRAVGKTTLARVFAKSINCLKRKDRDHEPCGKCANCESITAGKSLDILEIDAASHTGVDNVRDNVIASARVAPSSLKYKVFIIDEVHMLSVQAFNALLKTIEEPPANVIFILCTTEIHKVPTTIISRCQRFDFKRISVNDVTDKLNYIAKAEGVKIEKSILESIARQSEGHMRDAESILGQIISIGGKEISREEAELVIPRSDLAEIVNLLGFLGKKDAASGLSLVNKLIDEGVDLKTFVSDLVEVLRKILFSKINPILSVKLGIEFGEDMENKINEVSKDFEIRTLVNYIEEFTKARAEIRGSFIQQLPLEMAVVRLCVNILNTSSPSAPIRPTQVPPMRPGTVNQNKKAPENIENGGAPSMKSININSGEIASRWGEVLATVKKYNHSLAFILRVCEPREVDNSSICLAFKYKFHKDRVGDPAIKAIIEKVLKEVYGSDLRFESIIDEALDIRSDNGNGVVNEVVAEVSIEKTEEKQEDKKGDDDKNDMIGNLLKTFGGKIVN